MNVLNIILIALLSCSVSSLQAKEMDISNYNSTGGIWLKKPKFSIKNEELKGYDREAEINFNFDANGQITSTEIIKSTGLIELDNKLIAVVKTGKFKPLKENGVNIPSQLPYRFRFEVSRDAKFATEPSIVVKKSDLDGKDRSLNIYLEADDSGKPTKAKITKSSGLTKLNNYVLKEYLEKARFQPLSVNGKPYPIKMTKEFNFSLNFAE
ncbi:TonB family protein [Acinetobacter sp.]|uniref:TonB family protein n=1 Tax=Acinetobacter sp. TaxID=472 RepID=UPI00258E915E|nr:TonB family protein [Acinetobacter sp.]